MIRWGAVVLALGLMAACAHEKPKPAPPPVPRAPAAPRPRHVSVSPPAWYWEPAYPPDAAEDAKRIELPTTNDAITRIEGASKLWDEIGEPGRERLRRDGIVVLGSAAGDPLRFHLGIFYEEQRERRVPYVVTLDALHAVAHIALTRALAEIAEREIAPLLDAMLARIDTRLGSEQKGSSFEVASGYRLARGVIAVARLLADDKYVPAADIAALVREEQKRIDLHAGVATSPLLDVPIDYARFAGSPAAAPGKGSHRVLSWLSAAPFALVARTEAKGAPLDVGAVRHHARAAMLIARLADRNVDPFIFGALSRIAALSTFVWGASDDFTPLALGDIADSGGVDLAKPEVIANVVRVDKVRSLAHAARTPVMFDGSGGAGQGGVSLRLLGTSAPIDSVALAGLVGANGFPTTGDLDGWLRARTRVDGSTLHASVYGSLLDSLVAWSTPALPSRSADRVRFESVLASWTLARHASSSFGRIGAPVAPTGSRELRISGPPLPAFVEPEPEAIARLLATLRQTRRGLTALGPMEKSSPADLLLAEAEDIVKVCLEASASEDAGPLAAIPSRIALFETDAAVTGGPYATVVHSDPASGRALVSATGAIEPALMLVREPGAGRLVLATGAHFAHFEAIERTDQLEGAAALLERRIREGKATRASWTEGFRLAR